MLTTLRTELAWSGLPVLFITDEGSNAFAVRKLLERFGARVISREEATTPALATAVVSLLQAQA
jgi:hypothetical protein